MIGNGHWLFKSVSQIFMFYEVKLILGLYTRYPIVVRALGRVCRASKGILHTNIGRFILIVSIKLC